MRPALRQITAAWFSAERLPGRLARMPLRLLPPGTVVPILATRARGRRWIVGAGPHSCWLGWNELRKRRLFCHEVHPDTTVYDIGANVGSYSILAALLVGSSGRVFAFEPQPENVAFLRRHLELNQLRNVAVVQAAVADRTADVRFHRHRDRLRGRISPQGSDVVRAVRLDDLVSRGEIPPPDCMKIDVEGGELAVLRGAEGILAHVRPLIFLATHGDEVRGRCLGYLTENDYMVTAINGYSDEWIARPVKSRQSLPGVAV